MTIKLKSVKKLSPTNSLTNAIIEYVALKGGFAVRINTSGIPIIVNGRVMGWRPSKSKGHSDIYIVYNGKYIGVEIKKDDKLSPDQELFKNNIQSAGGMYWEIREFETFQKLFEKLK